MGDAADRPAHARPERIGAYRVVDELGAGGMGIVYRALHLGLQREVALKVLDPALAADAVYRQRFLREARALAAVTHPHVVTCYDAGWDPPHLYLAMELQPGGDVWRRVRRDGPLPIDEALRVVGEAALGLVAIHRAGLVHRDLKPANLFLAADGGVRVADLGLAAKPGDASLTSTGMVLGTPAFLSPEQAAGAAEVDARTDIYALGATLYALVTGRAPFAGDSAFAVVAQVLRDPSPDPRRLRPELPPAVADLIRRSMERDPARRPRDAAAFAAACTRLRGVAGPAPATPRRTPGALAAFIAAVLAISIGGGLAARAAWSARRNGSLAAPTTRVEPVTVDPAVPAVVPVVDAPSAVLAPPIGLVPDAPATADDAPPGWAAAHGVDAHGRWAEAAIGACRVRLRWCPAGAFTMGSPEDEPGRYGNERAHRVRLTRGFWLGATEVTRAQWREITGDEPASGGEVQLPVERVSWDDCQAFLARLGERLAGAHPRLPTEAEWEYACRAGVTAGTGGIPADGIWHRGNAGGATHPVGALPPNRWGLHDALGNVWEWCADGYGEYPDGEATDPLATGQRRVIRGGSFRYAANDCRPALRDAAAPSMRRDSVGLRVAISDPR